MAGVYISYPFCSQKCSFCNFASGVFPRELQIEYEKALLAEVRRHKWDWKPDTIYLGGGTPSHMDPALLHRLLHSIPGRPWREATIEAAPGSLTQELADHWRESGINRVSLGVQSFVTDELRQMGRKHTADTVAADCALLRGAGMENLNIDLIAGLPGQTAESWSESLDWIERLEPPHISIYIFEIDEDSRLGLEVVNGGLRYGAGKLPSDELTTELYETAVDRLAALGIERYEISNFAEPGMESLHNLKYWKLEPYAGFGADAHSFDGENRISNVETALEYVNRWREGRGPLNDTTPACPGEERFFVGLRLLSGIQPTTDEWRKYAEPIQRFVDSGLLERDGTVLKLTRRGVLLSNEVFQEFVHS
jgi:oxygen-independent coproporphyrinogen-3 oxidase